MQRHHLQPCNLHMCLTGYCFQVFKTVNNHFWWMTIISQRWWTVSAVQLGCLRLWLAQPPRPVRVCAAAGGPQVRQDSGSILAECIWDVCERTLQPQWPSGNLSIAVLISAMLSLFQQLFVFLPKVKTIRMVGSVLWRKMIWMGNLNKVP